MPKVLSICYRSPGEKHPEPGAAFSGDWQSQRLKNRANVAELCHLSRRFEMRPHHKGATDGHHHHESCGPERIIKERMHQQKPDADRSGARIGGQGNMSTGRAPTSVGEKKVTGNKRTNHSRTDQSALKPGLHPV